MAPSEHQLDHGISKRFWDQQAATAHDPRSVTLDRSNTRLVAWQVRLYQSWFFAQLEAMECRWERVVDLGCGNGDWTVPLARRAEHLWAVDRSEGFVRHCQERVNAADLAGRVTFETGELARVDIPASCDLVVCGAVFQYLNEDEIRTVLARIRQALRPSGILYLRTTVARKGAEIANCTDTYQAIYRKRRSYQELLAGSGFAIVRQATTARFMPSSISRSVFGSRLHPYLGWSLSLPVGIGWWLHRSFMDTDVWVCLCRPES